MRAVFLFAKPVNKKNNETKYHICKQNKNRFNKTTKIL